MTKHRIKIELKTGSAPVVELDSEARAAYVRFNRKRVVKTRPITTSGCIVTVDFDSDGEVVGVELVGVKEFGIKTLLEKAGITLPESMLEKARYVPSSLQAA